MLLTKKKKHHTLRSDCGGIMGGYEPPNPPHPPNPPAWEELIRRIKEAFR